MPKRDRRNILPTMDDLRVLGDDLRAQYEEILCLRAELDRLQARSKPSRKTQVPPKKPAERRRRFSLLPMRGY